MKRNWKRAAALLLALVMVCSVLPMTAMAALFDEEDIRPEVPVLEDWEAPDEERPEAPGEDAPEEGAPAAPAAGEEPAAELMALQTGVGEPLPVLPGFSLVRGVVAGNEYMIVTRDKDYNWYAFYPNKGALGSKSPGGDGVTDKYRTGQVSLAAALVSDGSTLAAEDLFTGDPISAEELLFTAEVGDTAAEHTHVDRFRATLTGYYLSIGNSMIQEGTSGLSKLTFQTKSGGDGFWMSISSSSRTLNFNKSGEVNSKWTNTNFWGPSGYTYPIYLYQKNTDDETEGLSIPGYTRLTELPEKFSNEKRYLIVSRTCTKDLYALYPSSTAISGSALSESEVHFAAGVKVKELDGNDLEAPVFTFGEEEVDEALMQLRIRSVSGGYQILTSTGAYLTLGDPMINESTPAVLTIETNADNGRFVIKTATNELDFNETGGAVNAGYVTDFWAPTSAKKDRALYIYESVASVASDDKKMLENAIANAEKLEEATYSAASWSVLKAAVDAGRALIAAGGTDEQYLAAADAITSAIGTLKLRPLTIEGYEQVTSLEGITEGYYLIIAGYTENGQKKYVALYPGAVSDNVNNGRALTVDAGLKVTGWAGGVTAESAENLFKKSGEKYSITAGSYILRLATGAVVYQTSGTSSIEITKSPVANEDCFRLKGPNGSYLIYYTVSSGYKFSQAGNLNNATYFPEMYLYRNTTKTVTVPGGGNVVNMLDGSGNNTWALTGGRAVQGAYKDIAGARSFGGQFEEYIRYTLVKKSGAVEQQRHVINTAYEGQRLADIVSAAGWKRVQDLDPKAVLYMPDPSEVAGADAGGFKTALTSFIDKGLALKGSDPSYVVIMKPYNTPADNVYSVAIDTVYSGLTEDQKANVKVVDSVTLSSSQLGEDGYPNAQGHLLLGQKLAEAVQGDAIEGFPGSPAAFSTALTASEIEGPWKDVFGAVAAPKANPVQAAIQSKAADTSKAMTWLFMGDSITHGAAWTYGYDSVPQLFEKFVKEDLGRKTDIVVNTANSGSTTQHTVSNLTERVSKYKADVVSIMLGTNDAAGHVVSVEAYKTNLKSIINAARTANAGALIILRTPIPTAASNRGEFVAEYAEAMKDVAEELDSTGSYILVVDQFTPWNALVMKAGDTTASFLFSQVYDKDTGMKIHPGPVGQLWMAQQFISETGLWIDSAEVCKLNYAMDTIPTSVSTVDVSTAMSVDTEARSITMNYELLSSALGATVYPLKGWITIEPTGEGANKPAKMSFSAHRLQETVPVVFDGDYGSWDTYRITAKELVDDNGTGKYLMLREVDVDLKATDVPQASDWTPLTPADKTGSVSASAAGYIFTGTGSNYAEGTDIYYNAKLNEAVEKVTGTKVVSFEMTPASSGSTFFGFAVRVTDNTKAYYMGYDGYSHWYAQRYNGSGNPYATFNSSEVENGHPYQVRIEWNDSEDKVRLWLDGVEQSLPNEGSFDGVPTAAVAAQFAIRAGTNTTLAISDLYYSGMDGKDLYFYNSAAAKEVAGTAEDYTAASWSAYQAALTEFNKLNLETDSQEKIDTVSKALIAAVEGLAEKPYEPVYTAPTGEERYRWADGATLEPGVYAVVTKGVCPNNANRILYHTGSGKTDKVTTTAAEYLTLNAGYSEATQSWELAKVEGGYTLRSKSSGRYLDLSAASNKNINTSADPVVLTITRVDTNLYTITQSGGCVLAFDGNASVKNQGTGNIYASATAGDAAQVYLYLKAMVLPTMVSDWHDMVPDNGTTQEQPFPRGTGGSDNFRIPAVVTLKNQSAAAKNGRIVAAIDARWNHAADACALDTILSWSDDDGATWHYSFPNYFGDSTDLKANNGTAFIDPVMVEGADGAIYLMVDLFPGGVAINTAPMQPASANGYVTVGGKSYLALYESGVTNQQSDSNWLWYIGDFENGYATVLNKADGSDTSYYVDEHYYLYKTAGGARGAEADKIYCARLGSAEYVQQNVFFYNSILHVRNASYLWITKSTDGGETWSAPIIANGARTDNQMFYGVGPGTGLSFIKEDGKEIVILPAYTFSNQIASFIYSADGGKTWKRSGNASTSWSSESVLVQIDGTTARHFYRDGNDNLTYTDHTLQSDGTWRAGTPVELTGVPNAGNNQLSAINYSQLIDGKPAVLVSTATGRYTEGGNATGRRHGQIHVLLVNEDKTMTLGYSFEINGETDYYGYSCLTELADGSVGLLYESQGSTATWMVYPIGEVANGALIGDAISITVPIYDSTVVNTDKAEAIAAAIAADATADAMVDVEAEEGRLTLIGLKSGEVTLTADGVKVSLTVAGTDDRQSLSLYVGDVEHIAADKDSKVLYNSDDAVVEAEVAAEEIESAIVNGAKGKLGANSSYAGAEVSMTAALYAFTDAGNGQFFIANGDFYLNPGGASGYPNSTTQTAITVTAGSAQGSFNLYGGGRYLHFWRDGKNYFDRVGSLSGYEAACAFLLFRPAASGETGAEIPGYVQVTRMSDITPGLYLIVAKVGENYFALNPSDSSSSKYAHVVKVTPAVTTGTTETVKFPAAYYLTLTALSVGTANVIADGRFYAVTVRKAKVAAPVATPGAGTYTAKQRITLTCATEGATIYYTIDGSDVDTTDPYQVYEEPFDYSITGPIKAIAVKEGMENSDLATFVYTFNMPLEVISFMILDPVNVAYGTEEADVKALLPTNVTVNTGHFMDPDPVVLAVNRWTCTQVRNSEGEFEDGGYDKDTSGYYRFVADVTLPEGLVNPNNATATIDVYVAEDTAVAPVTATPAAGTYDAALRVTLACADSDADIYYVSDDTVVFTEENAATAGTKYTAPIDVGAGTTVIRAVAVKDGNASVMSQFKYVVNLSKNITSVTNPDAVTVENGTEAGDIDLPETVTVMLSDGSQQALPVVWSCESYDSTKGGQYTFIGAITLPEDGSITNTGNKTAMVIVTVIGDPRDEVNFAELEAAIADAKAALAGVKVTNQSPAQVSKGTKFVSTEVKEALEAAIAAAEEALKNAATQAEADAAADALKLAVSRFNEAIQTGTRTASPRPTVEETYPKTEVEEKEDGTVVTTVTEEDGTVTVTTESPDGTVTEKVTQPDGTVTEKVTQPDGTVTEKVTQPDGTVTEKVTQPDGTVTEKVTQPDGTVTEKVTQPDGTVTETVKGADGSQSETVTAPDGTKRSKVTDPEGSVAITVTDAEGNVEIALELPAKTPELDERFVDVPEGHWAEEAINAMAAMGIVEGVSKEEHIFDMTGPLTRGTVATILFRFSHGMTGLEQSFNDVEDDAWYTDAIAWAAKVGIVNGYGNGSFGPTDEISREQLATILYRYAQKLGLGFEGMWMFLLDAPDADEIHDWASEAMHWMAMQGVLKGNLAGELMPQATASRAEGAVIFQRFIDLLK